MKHIPNIIVMKQFFAIILTTFALFTRCAQGAGGSGDFIPSNPQESKMDNDMLVRIAEIEVYPEWIDAYLAAARTVGAESVAKEPGVVCIFPMRQKENPCTIRIVEIYRNEEAYKAHLASPHFRIYKEGTPHMIKSLALVPMQPLDTDGMNLIFKKYGAGKDARPAP